MVIIMKRYFYRVATVLKIAFIAIRCKNYIDKEITSVILIICWRFICFRGWNIFNKPRLTIAIHIRTQH